MSRFVAFLFAIIFSSSAYCAPTVTIVSCTGVAITDTANLNAASATAAANGGGVIRVHGTCVTNATWTVAPGVSNTGDGPDNAWILPNSTAFDAIVCNPAGISLTAGVMLQFGATNTCDVQNLSIQYPAITSSGVKAVHFWATGTEPNSGLSQPIIKNVRIYNAPRGIRMVNAVGGHISDSVVMGFNDRGIDLSNTISFQDGGGLEISGNSVVNYQFFPACNRGYGIHSDTGAGLKVHHNSFACVARAGYFGLTGSSSQLTIDANTCDTAADACWFMEPLISGINFGGIVFKGNSCGSPTCIYLQAGPLWAVDVMIVHNKMGWANPNSLIFIGGARTYMISLNQAHNYGTAAGTFLNISSGAQNGTIGPNMHDGPLGSIFNSADYIAVAPVY